MALRYVDEKKYDRELGFDVKVRHLEQLTPELEKIMEGMCDFFKLSELLKSGQFSYEAADILKKYIDVAAIENEEQFKKTLVNKVEEFQKKQYHIINNAKTDRFFKKITDGKYPSYFTLNHTGCADPAVKIDGGIFVCSYKNSFWNGENKLYVFGSGNKEFRKYLKAVRRAAEEKEGKDFFKGLPLEITKEQIKQYIETNPEAWISFFSTKNPEKNLKKFGTDFVIGPKLPVGLTRINGLVKKQDLGEAVFSCFMGGIQKSEEEKKNGGTGKTFKGTYYGKDNLEAVSVLYSGLPYKGLGDWGGRIEVRENEVSPEIYKNFNYRFGDLAELMIDLRNRKVAFFQR